MKHLKLFFALFAMLALGVGNAWGAEVTETIKMKGFGGKTNNAYQNVTVSGTSDAGTAMVAYAYNGSTGQVRGNKTTVAGASVTNSDNGKNWSLYNSQAMGGAIKSITITQTATGTNKFQNQMYVSLGTTTQGAVTAIANAQQHTSLDANTITFDIDPSKGYTYFKLLSTKKFATGTIAGVEVKVTYETAGGDEGGEETVVSLPTFTPESGTTFTESLEVTLSAESGCDIYYTTDDTEPTTSSTKYTSSIKLTESKTIKAIANNGTKSSAVATATYTKVDPTGTFTLHTGELIEGDYVIYYSGKAMKAEVASSRLQYVEVTPSNDEIVDPATAAIWHIAKSGDNWTVYNNNKGYAAGTGTKSQAGLVANLTGDNANKAAWTVTASGKAYEFVNVYNTSKSVNATLRNNGTYGFACYATSTGGALSLYRKAGTKYNVTVSSTANGSVTASPTSAEAGATIALTVTPDAGYILDALTVTDASSNTIEVADNKFTMPAADVTITATFKENEAPDAVLQLMANGEELANDTHKVGYIVKLPTTINNDCAKTFVGWSENENCTAEPEYGPGAEFTITKTEHTLYAVYANVEGGEIYTTDNLFNKTNGSYNSTAGTIVWSLDGVVSILQAKSNASSAVADYVDAPRWYKDHLITITPAANITEIAVKAQSNDYATALANSTYTNATATVNGDIVTITPKSANEVVTIKMGAQARLSTLTVTYRSIATYSNYSTTCVAALDEPVFSVEGGENEAKTITLTATEGTIYYTLDGTTPTASSEKYTAPIVLDECGEHTIKAIAISSDSESPVAIATYKIQLPIEKGTKESPLSVDDVLAIYNGGCYNGTDEVYVTGTVSSASYNTQYSNYTVTLTDNAFQFYRLVDESNLVTDNQMQNGDVVIAKGKLGEYQGKCQLIECVLVDYKAYEGVKTDISNNVDDPYTVEEAYALIDDVSSDLDNSEVYVKGIISKVDSYNTTYKSITYWISDDGTTTKQLQVYSGKGLNNTDFVSKNDLQVGDKVIVFGKLKKHETTYEFDYNNYIVSLERPEQEETVAALPFTFTGSLSDVENTDGMKQSGLGSYNTSLKLKFDDTGDYLTIHFDGEPGRLRYGIKGNPSNNVMTCIYKVQTSVDGTTYKDLETYTTLANTEKTMSHALNSDVRYVKFVFAEKKSGNVALGNITISQPAIVIGDDDNSSVIATAVAAGNPVDVIVNRSFTANAGYYTLCVPFNMPASTIGTAYKLGAITKHVSGEEGGININLTKVDNIEAGVPYLIEPNITVDELLVENVTIVNTTGSDYTIVGDGVKIKFTGIINGIGETTNNSTEYYVGNGGYLYNGTVEKLGLRAFFTITDEAGNKVNVRARVVAGENVETGVEDIITTDAPVKVIVNGQLIIIRDGVKYNVQGQKL